jgi:ABC-type polar amino acid transport system ATPase subunit
MLSIRNLSINYNQKNILNNISCDFDYNSINVIMGSSGSGKTTFLRCLAKLEKKFIGDIYIKNQKLESIKANKIGMVFQSFNLFAHMTVLQNLVFAPIELNIMEENQAIEKAIIILKKLYLEDKVDHYPHSLSGGQKQRIAIARAIMLEPEVLLFDEPTSALDPELVKDISENIKFLKNEKTIIIVVTHEVRLAKLCADRILFFDNGILLDNINASDFFAQDNMKISQRAETFLSNIL